MVYALQNRTADQTEGVLILEQARTPVCSHRKRLNFERQLAHIHFLLDFAGELRVSSGVFQISQPFLHQLHDPIADAAGPVIKFQRRSGKEAATGENLFLPIQHPVLAKRSKTLEPVEFIGGTNYFFNEDVAGLIDYRALQIFLGAEVGEKTALADSERGCQLADCQSLKPFEGGEVRRLSQDCPAGF